MTAEQAVALLLRQHPALPPETAPVYLLLCGHEALTTPAVARHLQLAQSTAARLLALLSQSGLVAEKGSVGKHAKRWALTSIGRELAYAIAEGDFTQS